MIRDDSAFSSQDVIATTTATSASTDPARSTEKLKRDLLSEKVRTENRERKKRWREQNEDRNKDNDLRCRVNKRAHKLFGRGESEHKARWIEEEFEKRQLKRKDKERRRNPNALPLAEESSPSPTTPTKPSTVALSEHLTIQHRAQQAQQQAHRAQQEFQASQLANPQFDVTTVKTALALSDLVRKNGSHLDLAQLTGVLTDPNLARQLIEMEAQNSAPPHSMMVVNTSMNPDEIKSNHNLETDYPMDAVLTLMQLNGSWKA